MVLTMIIFKPAPNKEHKKFSMKLNISYLLILALFALTFSCDDDDDMEDTIENIVDLAQDNDQFTSLVAALDRADLVNTLQGDGPFTVFAPTNDAFAAFLAANNFDSVDDIPVDALSQVLLNHVVSGNVGSGDLTTGYVSTLSTNTPNDNNLLAFVDLTNGVVINGNATVTTPDLTAPNGVVHEVNAVIASPTVVTHALSNPDFSILVSALTRTGLTTDFVSVLSSEGPFTVFAPTNAAFVALLDSNPEWNALEDIPVETLEAVLLYHAVSGANVLAADLTEGMMVTALGGDFTISLAGGASINTSSGGSSNIIATDVQGTNGVVHAIDAVLIP